MPIRVVLLLAASVVLALPLALVSGLLAAWDPTGRAATVPVPAIVAAVTLGYALTLALMRRRIAERMARAALIVAGLAMALPLAVSGWLIGHSGAMPSDFGAIALSCVAITLVAWSQGAILARESLTFDAIYAVFRNGLLVFFAGLALALSTPGPMARSLADGAWNRVLLFFLAGLCALSLARVEEERRHGAGPEGPPPIRGEWLLTLLGMTAAVGVVGTLVAAFVAPVASQAPFGRLADLALWLLTPIIWLAAQLIEPLILLLRSFIPHRPRTLKGTPRGKHPPPPSAFHLTPTQALELGRIALIAAVLIAACIVMWVAVVRYQRRAAAHDGEEERESLWSWALLWDGLRAWFARLWRRFLGRQAEAVAGEILGGEVADVRTIRAIYRRLLSRAAAIGLSRRDAETPHEYLGRLRGAVPAGEKDAALLTGLYVHARYGAEAPSQSDVAAATEVWQRLESALRE